MKKRILASIVGGILVGWGGLRPPISLATAEEPKSVGTQAGEAARDMKKQFDETSQKLQASAQQIAQRLAEEWRKFQEAFNPPAKQH